MEMITVSPFFSFSPFSLVHHHPLFVNLTSCAGRRKRRSCSKTIGGVSRLAPGWSFHPFQSCVKILTLTPSILVFFILCIHFFHGMLQIQGVLLWKREEKSIAAEHFVKSAKLNPENGVTFRYLGDYYAHVSVDSQRAIKCYQRAVTLNPDDSDAGEAMCDLLDQGGKESLEISVCREASFKSPRAFWAFRRLGFLQVFLHFLFPFTVQFLFFFLFLLCFLCWKMTALS